MSAYATLVKAKDGQIAQLQAELAKHSEAVNTLASERTANAMLTAELEHTRAAAPVTQPQAAIPKGWKLVPEKVNNTMIDAFNDVPVGFGGSPPHVQHLWDAMLAAAPPSPQPVADSLTDAEINDITMSTLGKWPSFEAQSWACKVAHAIRAAALQPVAGLTDGVDYKLLLAKYIEHVGAEEGTDFTDRFYRASNGTWQGASARIEFNQLEKEAIDDAAARLRYSNAGATGEGK